MQKMYDCRMPYGYSRDFRSGRDFCQESCANIPAGTSALPDDPVVAMAYVPFQTCTEIYDECKALDEGTLFVALNKPFLGGCCR